MEYTVEMDAWNQVASARSDQKKGLIEKKLMLIQEQQDKEL